jgi:DNA-binding MarR family transcriptional regulator
VPFSSRDDHRWRLLSELEAGGAVSQRHLAQRLGIALGLANELVRDVVERGLVTLTRCHGARLEYRLTPAGVSHHARAQRAHLSTVVGHYCQARERIHARLSALADHAPTSERPLRIVFYDDGAGAADIGWLCLQGINLRLVGIVGETPGTSVYQMQVQSYDRLMGTSLGGEPFDRLVVMSFAPPHRIRTRLRRCSVPRGVTVWI